MGQKTQRYFTVVSLLIIPSKRSSWSGQYPLIESLKENFEVQGEWHWTEAGMSVPFLFPCISMHKIDFLVIAPIKQTLWQGDYWLHGYLLLSRRKSTEIGFCCIFFTGFIHQTLLMVWCLWNRIFMIDCQICLLPHSCWRHLCCCCSFFELRVTPPSP